MFTFIVTYRKSVPALLHGTVKKLEAMKVEAEDLTNLASVLVNDHGLFAEAIVSIVRQN